MRNFGQGFECFRPERGSFLPPRHDSNAILCSAIPLGLAGELPRRGSPGRLAGQTWVIYEDARADVTRVGMPRSSSSWHQLGQGDKEDVQRSWV